MKELNKLATEKPLLTLIQQIKDGRVNADTLDKELRQQCVEVFIAEGYTIASIAQILNKCEKTIKRDIEAIRERNALTPDIELAKKLIGEMVSYARVHRDHLMRLARSKETGISEKAQAEYYAHRVEMEMIDKLQTLGYLPLKPKTIVGDFTYSLNVSDDKALFELKRQLLEVENLALEEGSISPELAGEIKRIKARIEQAEIEKDILKIQDQQNKEQEHG
jgi:transposase-like protein